MVLNGNECSNALYNANHRELHVSTLMGFWSGLDCTKKQHAKFFHDRRQNTFVCRGKFVEGFFFF